MLLIAWETVCIMGLDNFIWFKNFISLYSNPGYTVFLLYYLFLLYMCTFGGVLEVLPAHQSAVHRDQVKLIARVQLTL